MLSPIFSIDTFNVHVSLAPFHYQCVEMGERQIFEALQGLKPALLMMVVQIAYAGVNVFYKLATNDGMNPRIIVAYRFIFATALIGPLAFFIERYVFFQLQMNLSFSSSTSLAIFFLFHPKKESSCVMRNKEKGF